MPRSRRQVVEGRAVAGRMHWLISEGDDGTVAIVILVEGEDEPLLEATIEARTAVEIAEAIGNKALEALKWKRDQKLSN